MKLDPKSYLKQLTDLKSSLGSGSVMDKANSLLGKLGAKNLMNGSPSEIIGTLPKSSAAFTNSLNQAGAKLASLTTSAKAEQAEADKEFDSMSSQLNGGDNTSALAQDTSFVTGSAMSNIRALDLETQADIPPSTEEYDETSLAKLEEASGTEIKSDADLALAQESMCQDMKIDQCDALGNSDALTADVVAADSEDNQTLPWKPRESFTPLPEETPTDLTSDDEAVRQAKIGDRLPSGRIKTLWDEEPGVVSKTYESRKTDMAELPSGTIDDPEGGLQGLFGMGGDYNDYPEVADENGFEIPGVSGGNAGYKKTDSLYNLAEELCGITSPNMTRYGSNKDKYDLAVNEAAQNGLSDLLNRLLSCAKFFDARTETILGSSLSSLASKGDLKTFSTVVDHLGVGSVANPRSTLQTLGTNMDPSEENLDQYDHLAETIGFPSTQLMKDQEEPDIYSGEDIAYMSANSPDLVERHLGQDQQDVFLGAYTLYA